MPGALHTELNAIPANVTVMHGRRPSACAFHVQAGKVLLTLSCCLRARFHAALRCDHESRPPTSLFTNEAVFVCRSGFARLKVTRSGCLKILLLMA